MADPAIATVTLLLVCGLLSSAAAVVYNVGGDGGWTLQTQTSTFYDDQFKNITLYTGDGLNFVFTVGSHNVYEILPEAVASCDISDPVLMYSAPTTIYPSIPGTKGFVCGFLDHCSQFGMHLTVTFVSSDAPAPAPSPEVPAERGD
ncbi:unnamed protein product [Calypogeia fissa]